MICIHKVKGHCIALEFSVLINFDIFLSSPSVPFNIYYIMLII